MKVARTVLNGRCPVVIRASTLTVLVGSALRLVYLAAWLSPLLLAFPLSKFQIDSVNIARAIAIFVGVEISAVNHLVLDGMILPLPIGVKRRLKGD